MRYRLHPWQIAALLILSLGALLTAAFWLRNRSRLTTGDLIASLPRDDSILLFLDIAELRRAGVLDLVAGSRVAEEPDYRGFVAESGFDYRQDLDTVAAAFQKDDVFLLIGGRFDLAALKRYTEKNGGNCYNGFCRIPASRPNRHISYRPLRSNLLAMAVSADDYAAVRIRAPKAQTAQAVPLQPVWFALPESKLREGFTLPNGLRVESKALGRAEHITLALGAAGDRFEALLEAACRTPADATAVRGELEELTAAARKSVARSGEKVGPRDLAGVLTSGVFEASERVVRGRWPIERALLEAIAEGPR